MQCSYLPLANRLGKHRAVYALDDGVVQGQRSFSFQTIENAASLALPIVINILTAHYKSSKAKREVHLAGWSYGGVLAVEIAKQLIALGEDTDLLSVSMFDAPLRSDVVKEDEDGRHLPNASDDDGIMLAANEHFKECTKLLRMYHQRPVEQQALQCTVLDIRPQSGQKLLASADSVTELTSGRVEKKTTSGDHWTMLSNDNVDNIVQIMNDVIKLVK